MQVMSTVQRKVAVSPTLRVRFSGACRIVGRPHTFTAIHTRLGLFGRVDVHFMIASHSRLVSQTISTNNKQLVLRILGTKMQSYCKPDFPLSLGI